MARSIQIKGLKEVQDYLRNFPSESKKRIRTAVNKSLRTVERNAIIEAPVNTGELRAKRRVVATHAGGFILFFAKHAFSLHNGTSPHRVKLIKGRGLHFWATKKGISPHAVALSIKRKGTKANAFLDRAVMRSERTINKIFSNALKAIARAIKKINI